MSVTALATSKKASLLDKRFKHKLHWALTCSGRYIAKLLASQEDTGGVIVTEGVESVFGFLLPLKALQESQRMT